MIHEWRRYTAAVIALAFSGLLVLAQVGMFMGIGEAFTATIDRSPADIIILSPKAQNLDDADGLPNRIKPTLYMHPDVTMVSEMAGNGARYQNQPKGDEKQKSTFVQIMGVDPNPGSASLPPDFGETVRRALLEPYAVAVDETALKALGVKVGDEAILNGRRIKIAATVTGYPNMMQTQVFMSPDTMYMLGLVNPARITTGPLMVKIGHPERAMAVRDDLNAASKGKYRAWTRPELAKANQAMIFQEQIIGVLLGFTVILGIGIGIGITSQTLRGAILANIKEFASLRALGVSMGSLRMIVLELSFWVGVVGVLVAFLLTWGVSLIGKSAALPMAFPPVVVGSVAGMLLIIAMVSGFLSLGLLKKSQPADLLR